MTDTSTASGTGARKGRERHDFVRIDVLVRKDDADLVRGVAAALCDPGRATETRAIMRDRIAAPGDGDLKALLESAPLDGIDLERQYDVGREVSL